MAVKHTILGKGTVVQLSPINVGGYNYKVRFENGLTKWCSKSELKKESWAPF